MSMLRLCTDISQYILPVYFPYSFVTILNCTLFADSEFPKPVQIVSFLSITSTNLQNICPIVTLIRHVTLLDASKNSINKIQSLCFNNKVTLTVIKLNYSMLQYIQKFAFHKLHFFILIYQIIC